MSGVKSQTKSEFTSTLNNFKMTLEAQTAAPPPVREFKPLKVQPHPRAAEMQAYAALPSRFKSR